MDIEYKRFGFMTMFFPCSEAGQVAWRQFYEKNAGDKVLNNHAKGVIKQFRDAGYIVKKAA